MSLFDVSLSYRRHFFEVLNKGEVCLPPRSLRPTGALESKYSPSAFFDPRRLLRCLEPGWVSSNINNLALASATFTTLVVYLDLQIREHRRLLSALVKTITDSPDDDIENVDKKPDASCRSLFVF
jgi:hypothetical protein